MPSPLLFGEVAEMPRRRGRLWPGRLRAFIFGALFWLAVLSLIGWLHGAR